MHLRHDLTAERPSNLLRFRVLHLEELNISLHSHQNPTFKSEVAFDSQPAYISTDTEWGRKVFGVYEGNVSLHGKSYSKRWGRLYQATQPGDPLYRRYKHLMDDDVKDEWQTMTVRVSPKTSNVKLDTKTEKSSSKICFRTGYTPKSCFTHRLDYVLFVGPDQLITCFAVPLWTSQNPRGRRRTADSGQKLSSLRRCESPAVPFLL